MRCPDVASRPRRTTTRDEEHEEEAGDDPRDRRDTGFQPVQGA